MMRPGKKCIECVSEFEGFSATPYLCPAKVPTIGYGSTFYPNGVKVTMNDKAITKEQGYEMLKDTLVKFSEGVNKLVRTALNQNQFDALVSFAYNLGVGALSKSTLLKKVNANPVDPSIADEFAKWNKAGGKELSGLTRRRKFESELYFSK